MWRVLLVGYDPVRTIALESGVWATDRASGTFEDMEALRAEIERLRASHPSIGEISESPCHANESFSLTDKGERAACDSWEPGSLGDLRASGRTRDRARVLRCTSNSDLPIPDFDTRSTRETGRLLAIPTHRFIPRGAIEARTDE